MPARQPLGITVAAKEKTTNASSLKSRNWSCGFAWISAGYVSKNVQVQFFSHNSWIYDTRALIYNSGTVLFVEEN
jgi:hypothetical protein